jgi:hypothetical protein
VNERHLRWPLLVLALLCLVAVAGGVALVLADGEGGEPLGWALIGFFGSGAVVLGRKAVTANHG